MTTVAVRVRITGQVQGVWFRGWTEREAIRRGLEGWVRNERDGSVEALFAGPEDKVQDMVEACRAGPPAAEVATLQEWRAEPPSVSGFHCLPTD